MMRPAPQPWACPLCERPVVSVHMWREHFNRDGKCAIYFHGDGERCFVANQQHDSKSSHIREIADPR